MSFIPSRPFRDGYILSVVIPVYNEARTVSELIHRVRVVELPVEIIVVDDGSKDGTVEILKRLESKVDKIVYHDRNQGKGAAIRTGIEHVTGDMVIIQDADLEYDPMEYPNLIAPILEGKAEVVYGSRFMGGRPRRVHLYWHSVANWALTTLSNMVTNLNLTDMETCFKVFKTDVIRRIRLRESGFGVEPEITAKLARLHCPIYEVGISYHGRSYDAGKKIGMKDAFWALFCILRYGLWQRFTKADLIPAAKAGDPGRRDAVEERAEESSESGSEESSEAGVTASKSESSPDKPVKLKVEA